MRLPGDTHMAKGQSRWEVVTIQMVGYGDCHGNGGDMQSKRSRYHKLSLRRPDDKGQGLFPQKAF